MEQFTQADIMLIEKEITRKSYSDIAFLLDKSKEDLSVFLSDWLTGRDVIPYELILQQKRQNKTKPERKLQSKKKVKPAPEKKQTVTAVREQVRYGRRERERQSQFKTKQQDFTGMQRVRIDHKTEILIKPGLDPEKEKARYIQSLKAAKSSTFHKTTD